MIWAPHCKDTCDPLRALCKQDAAAIGAHKECFCFDGSAPNAPRPCDVSGDKNGYKIAKTVDPVELTKALKPLFGNKAVRIDSADYLGSWYESGNWNWTVTVSILIGKSPLSFSCQGIQKKDSQNFTLDGCTSENEAIKASVERFNGTIEVPKRTT